MNARDLLYSLGLALAAWPPLFERAPQVEPQENEIRIEAPLCRPRVAAGVGAAKDRERVDCALRLQALKTEKN